MSTKRNQATTIGTNGGQDRTSGEGGDDHIDKKFKQVHGDGDEDDEEDDEEEAPKSGKRAGRRKIKIEYIEDKSRRHITFSKRKSGIMKKAYELSTLTGTQVLLLVVSETGLVYTFTTPKLQPLVTKAEGKNLIQACLHAPDKEATPEQYPNNEQEGSPTAGSGDEDNDQNSSSPVQPPIPSPQQQQQSIPQNATYSGPSGIPMYPAPYSHIPYPAQAPGQAPPYSYPNMGMPYQTGPPPSNPNGPPPAHPSSQYWAPSPQQQQAQQAVGSGAPPAPSKGARADK